MLPIPTNQISNYLDTDINTFCTHKTRYRLENYSTTLKEALSYWLNEFCTLKGK